MGSQLPRAGCSPTARRWEPKGTWCVTEMETLVVAEEVEGEEEAKTAGRYILEREM